MARILAIDYGKKRSGIAVTDITQTIASPLTTVPTVNLEIFLKDYTAAEDVEAIVIGYPKTMNNLPSESVKYIDPFISRLRKIFPDIDLHLVDERFTSSMAIKAMIEGGMKKSDRRDKSNVDKISASLILQSYLQQAYSKKNR